MAAPLHNVNSMGKIFIFGGPQHPPIFKEQKINKGSDQ